MDVSICPVYIKTWYHWPFCTNPVEDRAKYQKCMTFGFILYRISGEKSMKCQISCAWDKHEVHFSPCEWHRSPYVVDCGNTWKSAPQFGRPFRCSAHGYSFVRVRYFLYSYTTCRICTWICRSHQLNNNIWQSLVRIQKCSTHFHSMITFFKRVYTLIKSNNSNYIREDGINHLIALELFQKVLIN